MPRTKRVAVEVVVLVVLMYLSGQFPIEIHGTEVPITLQSMVAILLPLRFSREGGVGGMTLFLLLAVLGVPVLSGGTGGWEKFTGPSGGYLIGFLMVALAGRWADGFIRKPYLRTSIIVFLLQHVVILVLGLSWLSIGLGMSLSPERHVLPFLPGLLLKSALGGLAYIGLRKLQDRFA